MLKKKFSNHSNPVRTCSIYVDLPHVKDGLVQYIDFIVYVMLDANYDADMKATQISFECVLKATLGIPNIILSNLIVTIQKYIFQHIVYASNQQIVTDLEIFFKEKNIEI